VGWAEVLEKEGVMDTWVNGKLRKDGDRLVLELFKPRQKGQSFSCLTVLVGNLGNLCVGKEVPIRVQQWEDLEPVGEK
jgi:hypothetical protein